MFSSKFLQKNPSVQERWYRSKFQKIFGHKLKILFLWHLHRKLNKNFRVVDKAINHAIDTTVFEYRRIDENLFPATKQLFNIGLFFLLAERDVQALKADAFAHPNKTKRNIALRTLLLTIYEWDMSKVTGRRMQFIYEVTGLSDTSKSAVVMALKELKKARKDIESQLSETRHNTIAHREADALRQYEIITNLEITQFAPALTKFYYASDILLNALTTALIEISTTKSLFQQVVHQQKNA
ncbi:hypothetical protein [uncultured Tolumonas sp.]|uniref:hypothetical protein n=1 Tax=uncultured Tolumonas sp. TaxID=263765 RepID=UPI00292D259D|nr:hypothetical protein [uncultured Tolumonas sp.]